MLYKLVRLERPERKARQGKLPMLGKQYKLVKLERPEKRQC